MVKNSPASHCWLGLLTGALAQSLERGALSRRCLQALTALLLILLVIGHVVSCRSGRFAGITPAINLSLALTALVFAFHAGRQPALALSIAACDGHAHFGIRWRMDSDQSPWRNSPAATQSYRRTKAPLIALKRIAT